MANGPNIFHCIFFVVVSLGYDLVFSVLAERLAEKKTSPN